MPVSGACAFVITRAEIAQGMRHQPAYVLGGATPSSGTSGPRGRDHHRSGPVERPGRRSGWPVTGRVTCSCWRSTDSYTITVICELEDAGFCEKGEGGDWIQEQDLTFKGNLPLNTHGGQISYGQAALAGGCSHVTEAVRQIRRTAGERQVPGPTDIALVTGSGGLFSQQSAMVLSSDEACR